MKTLATFISILFFLVSYSQATWGLKEQLYHQIYIQMGNQQEIIKKFQVKDQVNDIDISWLNNGQYYIVLRLNENIWDGTSLIKQ